MPESRVGRAAPSCSPSVWATQVYACTVLLDAARIGSSSATVNTAGPVRGRLASRSREARKAALTGGRGNRARHAKRSAAPALASVRRARPPRCAPPHDRRAVASAVFSSMLKDTCPSASSPISRQLAQQRWLQQQGTPCAASAAALPTVMKMTKPSASAYIIAVLRFRTR